MLGDALLLDERVLQVLVLVVLQELREDLPYYHTLHTLLATSNCCNSCDEPLQDALPLESDTVASMLRLHDL
mgnify:CR=1 FL=1